MHYRIRYMHVKYQLNRVKRFVKTVNTKNKLNCINLQLATLFAKICKLHKFATCNQNFEKSRFFTCTTPLQTFRPIFEINRPLDMEIPQKEIISTDDRRTVGRTDGQTARQTDGRTDVAYDNNR